MSQTSTDRFAYLYSHPYLLLTTYRKNGTPMPTAVWFTHADGHIYITTQAQAGKVKRIRNNSHVELAPCDRTGNILGESVPAQAREVPRADHARIHELLTAKYGEQYTGMMSTRPPELRTYLDVTPEA